MKNDCNIEMRGLWPPSTPAEELLDTSRIWPPDKGDSASLVSPLAIKLNNLFLWGAAGCFIPYMSVYYLHYAAANEDEFGALMSVSAVVGTILNIVISSLSDRYRAHRLAHLLTMMVSCASVAVLFVPILTNQDSGYRNSKSGAEEPLNAPMIDMDEDEASEAVEADPSSGRALWFYLITFCVAVGSLGITINMNFSDSFSANIGRRCAGKESYGTVRFYGALGWCLASLALTFVNERAAGLPYLFIAWTLFACLIAPNILLVLFWPNKEPFNLSANNDEPASCDGVCGGAEQGAPVTINFGRNSWRLSASKPPEEPVGLSIRFRSHSLETLNAKTSSRPEVRRCSIAALGSSHVIEQFQLAPPPPNFQDGREELRRWPNEQNMNGLRELDVCVLREHHFKHITKVQPIDQHGSALLAGLELPPAKSARDSLDVIGFKLYMKIIELIARRNRNMMRFMALYAAVGFTVAMNWYFLFPYLEMLNARKFLIVAPYVMMSAYISETLFYFVWPRLPVKLRPSVCLSLILFAFALRYLAYLSFSMLSADVWPLELVIGAELLQSLTIGWFDCIINESAVEFALEAEHCLPRLIELGLVDGSRESAELVKNSVKLSLLGLSSCFYDGIGVALGALVGGWIIVRHDYSTLWSISASLALLVGLANLLLEWTVFADKSPARAAGKPTTSS